MKYKCPNCGESKNLHLNYDYSKQHRPVKDVLCNNCGEFFDGDMTVDELLESEGEGEYPELEGTLALCDEMTWDNIYEEYSNEQYPPFGGPFPDSISFIDWLKRNYKAPEKI